LTQLSNPRKPYKGTTIAFIEKHGTNESVNKVELLKAVVEKPKDDESSLSSEKYVVDVPKPSFTVPSTLIKEELTLKEKPFSSLSSLPPLEPPLSRTPISRSSLPPIKNGPLLDNPEQPLFDKPKNTLLQESKPAPVKPTLLANTVDQDEQLKATFELLKAEANQPVLPTQLDESYLSMSDEPLSSSIREEITEEIVDEVGNESEPSFLIDSDLQTTDRSVTPLFSTRNEHDYSEPVDPFV
jgi:hypothetical protein